MNGSKERFFTCKQLSNMQMHSAKILEQHKLKGHHTHLFLGVFYVSTPFWSSSQFKSLASTKKFSIQTTLLTINSYWQTLLVIVTKSLSLSLLDEQSHLFMNMLKEKKKPK